MIILDLLLPCLSAGSGLLPNIKRRWQAYGLLSIVALHASSRSAKWSRRLLLAGAPSDPYSRFSCQHSFPLGECLLDALPQELVVTSHSGQVELQGQKPRHKTCLQTRAAPADGRLSVLIVCNLYTLSNSFSPRTWPGHRQAAAGTQISCAPGAHHPPTASNER